MKEKIIQIAASSDPTRLNPIILTNKGRILQVICTGLNYCGTTTWRWTDITPNVEDIKK